MAATEEKLRALLAEARGAIDEGYDRGIPSIIQRIDAALAEPVVDDFKRGAEAMREEAAKAVWFDFATEGLSPATVTRAVRVIKRCPLPEDR